MCCEGKEIKYDEIIDPNMKEFREALFTFLGGGLGAGPSMPSSTMPINAPNDPNFAAGMNMFREMGGMSPNYTPYQAPQYWNPQWNPQWPAFSMPDLTGDKKTSYDDFNRGDDKGERSKQPNKKVRDYEKINKKNPGK